jgi:2-isopropylmalate synthase
MGPVDAVCRAINKVVGQPGELVQFEVNAITEGIDAIGEVTVHVQEYGAFKGTTNGSRAGGSGNGRYAHPMVFSGHGVDTDILVASAEAYLAALNKLFQARLDRQAVTRGTVDYDVPSFEIDLFGSSALAVPAAKD